MLMIEYVDLGLKRPDTDNSTIVEKVLIMIREVVIGLRPATLHPITHVTMVDCCVYLLLLVLFTHVFTEMKEVIVVVMTEDVDLGLKKPDTIPFKIVQLVLMVMGEVDIGLRPAPLPHIIQVILVHHWGFILVVMREVDIGLIPVTLLHITMGDYTFFTQCSLKKLLQGLCKVKIFKTVIKDVSYTRIKIIIIIII